MQDEVLLAIIEKAVELRVREMLADETALRGPRGLRGREGIDGRDGKDFVFSEHEDKIRNIIKEYSLKFEDLSAEQISELRGPKGSPGRDGLDGRDFDFEESKEKISALVTQYISSISSELKLKFSDLTDEDKLELRGEKGPRGQRGRPGKDFVFEEHIEFFQSLKPKFSDFTEEEREQLRLKFKDLSKEEVENLKLHFSDLTDEEKEELRGQRGPRGQRGREGAPGEKGEKGDTGEVGPRGPQGLRGIPGVSGPRGFQGEQGPPGRDGEDAPRVIDVEVDQRGSKFTLTFVFDDGSRIETDYIKLPAPTSYFSGGGGGGGGGGSSTTTAENVGAGAGVYKEKVGDSLKFKTLVAGTGTAITEGTDTITITSTGSGDGGIILYSVPCESDVYVSSAVRMKVGASVPSNMDDWTTLSAVTSLDYSIPGTTVAANALADGMANSNVLGFCINKVSPTICDIRVTGSTGEIFTGLDVTEEYYLSDTVPGLIVKSADAPDASGTVLLKLGQPFSDKKFVVIKGERIVRL